MIDLREQRVEFFTIIPERVELYNSDIDLSTLHDFHFKVVDNRTLKVLRTVRGSELSVCLDNLVDKATVRGNYIIRNFRNMLSGSVFFGALNNNFLFESMITRFMSERENPINDCMLCGSDDCSFMFGTKKWLYSLDKFWFIVAFKSKFYYIKTELNGKEFTFKCNNEVLFTIHLEFNHDSLMRLAYFYMDSDNCFNIAFTWYNIYTQRINSYNFIFSENTLQYSIDDELLKEYDFDLSDKSFTSQNGDFMSYYLKLKLSGVF